MSAAASSRKFGRVVLETTLKPFRRLEEGAVRDVCSEMFRQWEPLIRHADASAVLLWAADGTEILTYKGRLDEEFEWARYIGFANWQYPHAYEGPNAREERKAQVYTGNPPVMTYGWLKTIIASIKDVGSEITGKPVSVGATFDPGPEFANSPFRYELHTEILPLDTGDEKIKRAAFFVRAYAELDGDSESYAGFPAGIPQGTPFGRFLGRQAQHFLSDLGYDYIWFSNGFGFSEYGTSSFGEVFDGREWKPERANDFAEKTLQFWRYFREECPSFPIETRGTNFSTGADLASDGVPLEGIYRGGFNVAPPVNSPWGALDADFGIEMVGYMSRIAEIPHGGFPFRYYALDPWFAIRPWWEIFERQPFDIYCPLSVGRVGAEGVVGHPSSVAILSVDAAEGHYPQRCPIEVIPHLLLAADHTPDAPGLVTWVYPFREYHEMTFGTPKRPEEVYLGDWFVRNAVNSGFPLNTVVSSDNFVRTFEGNRSLYADTCLFTQVPGRESRLAEPLCDFVRTGGRVLLYGPTAHAAPRVRDLLNLATASPIGGVLAIDCSIDLDRLESGRYPNRIHHRELTSAGGITEIVRDPSDADTVVCATVSTNGQERVAALVRKRPDWNGGIVGWVRGTNSFSTDSMSHLPVMDDPAAYFDGSCLLRFMLAHFGYCLAVDKESPAVRTPLCFVSRVNNGFYFNGHAPDTTVTSRFRFPFGAPLLQGTGTRLTSVDGDAYSSYNLGRCLHAECRVFIDQRADGTVSCHELARRSTNLTRRIRVTGLKRATVRFFPEADVKDRAGRTIYVTRATQWPSERGDEKIPYERASDGLQLVARDVSGDIVVSW